MLAAQVVLTALLLFIALYAQQRIGLFTAGARKAMLTRTVLAAVGVLAGGVAVAIAPAAALAPLVFMQAFGLVHAPAALILFFKRARGEGRS